MTDLNETIKVMQHFRDGGEVEARHISGMTWGICRDPDWNFALFEYRIKPEKKKRLMTPEELKGKWLKNQNGVVALVHKMFPERELIWFTSDKEYEKGRLIHDWVKVQDIHDRGWTLENGDSLEIEVEEGEK